MSTYLLPNFIHRVHHVRLTGGLIEGEGIIYCLYDGARGFSEVGGIIWGGLGSLFMVEKLDTEVSVSGRMDLVIDMATDTMSETRQNTCGMPFNFLSLS